MTPEEFVRKNYCRTHLCLFPSAICESDNSFCRTAQAMLDAAKWREENPNGIVGINAIEGGKAYSYETEGYFFQNHCRSCGNLCIISNCDTAYAIKKVIELKDQENQKATANHATT